MNRPIHDRGLNCFKRQSGAVFFSSGNGGQGRLHNVVGDSVLYYGNSSFFVVRDDGISPVSPRNSAHGSQILAYFSNDFLRNAIIETTRLLQYFLQGHLAGFVVFVNGGHPADRIVHTNDLNRD